MTAAAPQTAAVVNLIPAHIRESAIVRRRARAWIVGAVCLAAVLALACALVRFAGGQEQSRLSNDGGRLAERLAAAEASLDSVRSQVREHARRLEASETVGVHPDWSVLLNALAAKRGDDIMLHSVDLRSVETDPVPTPGKRAPAEAGPASAGGPGPAPVARRPESYSLRIKGFGLSQGDVVRFVRRLEELGPLVEVQLKESRAQPYLGVPAVGFAAECRLIEGSPARADAEKVP